MEPARDWLPVALIVGLGAAMGIQNAALSGALLVRHPPVCYRLAIALVTIVLGAVTSHTPGGWDPAWSEPRPTTATLTAVKGRSRRERWRRDERRENPDRAPDQV